MGRKKKRVYPHREETRTTLSFPKEYNEQIKKYCRENRISRVDFVKLSIEKVCGSPASPRRNSRSILDFSESIEEIKENTDRTFELMLSLKTDILEILKSINSKSVASERLNAGRKRYIEQGGKLGRPAGTAETKEQLAVKYKQLIKVLKSGISYRKAAKLCDCSDSTAKRVKKLFSI